MYFMVLIIALLLMLSIAATAGWKQDDFIITFWCPLPATEEALANVAAEGYNLTWAPEDGLDAVNRHGTKALLMNDLLHPDVLDDPAKEPLLDALIDRVKNHPALQGYYITDEPGSGAFPGLGRLFEYIRKRDPKHFAYVNLFPTYATKEQLGVTADAVERAKVGIPLNFQGEGTGAETVAAYNEHLRLYLDQVKPELISYDHYHFLQIADGEQYFLNLELIRDASIESKLPFLNIIQACTIEKSWRLVNKDELRFLVYTTLAYGGRGISYFLYWGPESYGGLYQEGKKTPLADDVAALNRELKSIGTEMMKLDTAAVYHTAPVPKGGRDIPSDSPVRIRDDGEYVLGLFKDSAGNEAFMIVNRDYKKASAARIDMNCNAGLKEFNRTTGEWKPYVATGKGEVVTIELKPADGRLFRICKTD